jgi:hypothetical protein
MCKTPYVYEKVMSKIEGSAENSIFFLTDFAEDGAIETVRKVLGDACKEGKLIHVAHGIYVKPKRSRFGIVPPPMEQTATAIAKRDHVKIMPTGATAANIIGLSTQIPMTYSYLTTGTTRNIIIGNQVLKFKRAAPRNFAYKGTSVALVVQALKEIGRKNVGSNEKSAIYKFLLNSEDREYQNSDALLAPQWIQAIIRPMIKKMKTESK